ncbi:MAG: GTPase HflX, partial [Parvibaculaceae bacterium]
MLHVERKGRGARVGSERDAVSRLEEAVGLARAIDLVIAAELIVPINEPRPATLIGKGKVDEVAALVKAHEAELVVVNAQLLPIQQRNLEKAWGAKVLDRTGLILEIFGRRARTSEGKLQVELAHLKYQKSRLVRSWTHLERQRGGFGFLGGPGESQLEADRRLIQERIARLEKQLESVVKTRSLHRAGRARVPYPVVALAGYTNAGKSTLFNTLTRSEVLAKDLLFATLDPAMRAINLPHGRKAVLSDTVGFIADLPTSLIAAFRATLEEVIAADVILHVRDISHDETDAQADDVSGVLAELGISEAQRGHIIEVWNKADRLPEDMRDMRRAQASRRDDTVLISALTGEGLSRLLAMIEDKISSGLGVYSVAVEPQDGKGQAWLHQSG